MFLDNILPVNWQNLTSSSNCGFPGRWILDVTDSANASVANLSKITHFDEVEVDNARSQQLFLLPFGPKHGDRFLRKSSSSQCTYVQLEDQTFLSKTRPNSQYNRIRVCSTGYIIILDWCSSSSLSSCQYPVLAIYPTAYTNTADNLVDYMCTEAYFDTSSSNYDTWRRAYNYEFCSFFDTSHVLSWDFFHQHKQLQYTNPNYQDYTPFTPSHYDFRTRHLYTEAENHVIEAWNELISTSSDELDIHSDDQLAQTLMGSETTKYVNLANNVFKRQTTDAADLSTINSLLQLNYPHFEASWALVATWYKLQQQYAPSKAHNSYQAIITCGIQSEVSSSKHRSCFIIFDYFEVQWTSMISSMQDWWRWIPGAGCGVKENRGSIFVSFLSLQVLWLYSNLNLFFFTSLKVLKNNQPSSRLEIQDLT